jgi:SAM-dependent methyltransferase
MVDSLHAGVHRRLVFNRRRDRLVRAIESAMPEGRSVIDIGCGNGEIGAALAAQGRDVVGVETLARRSCEIPMVLYDGVRLPFDDDAFDWAVIVDVLHHAPDPGATLAEARRVTRRGVIVKDHYAETSLQRFRLGVMDWVGNRQFGVGRDGEYLSRSQWAGLWQSLGLEVCHLDEDLDLYPTPVDLVFERGLHFVARLEPLV